MSFKSAWLNDRRITNVSPLPVFDLYSSAYYQRGYLLFNLSIGILFLSGPAGWFFALGVFLRDWILASLCALMFLLGYWNGRDVDFSYSLRTIFYESKVYFAYTFLHGQDEDSRRVVFFWLSYCLYLRNSSDFQRDYLLALNQHGSKSVHLFSGTAHHEMRIDNWTDDKVLKVLKAHFRLFEQKRPAGVLSLKTLTRVAVVKVSHGGNNLGKRLKTLQLGRDADRNVKLLFHYQNAGQATLLSNTLNHLPDNRGLEFVYEWDSASASQVVFLPVFLSLSFIAAWLIYQKTIGELDENTSTQTTIQTAFTVGGYIVTTSIAPARRGANHLEDYVDF